MIRTTGIKCLLFVAALTSCQPQAVAKRPNQNDYILDHKVWYCSQYGSESIPSAELMGQRSGVYKWWVGKERVCVKYERRGVV